MNKICRSLSSIIQSPAVHFYLIVLLVLFLEWTYFALSIGGFGNKIVVTLCKGLGDCAILLILYWFLPKRFAWVSIVIVWLLSIFFLLNLWYFRFWNQLITPLFYRLMVNMNGDTIASVKALFSIIDLLYLLLPAGLTFVYVKIFKARLKKDDALDRQGFWNYCRILMIMVSIFLFFISQVGYAVTKSHWNRDAGLRDKSIMDNIRISLFERVDTASIYDLRCKGLPSYFISALNNIITDLMFSHAIKPTAEELADLKQFVENIPEYPVVEEFASNTDKNVVIILVESFNAEVINSRINGHEITPFINSLIKNEGTVSALDIMPQVKDGCSNDGQLLANTGLLPLSRGVASMTFGQDVSFPGLPKILKPKSSVAIFGDAGLSWNQTEAYKSYGFEKIYSVLDYQDLADKEGADAAMFDFSNAILDTISQPFLLEFVTFSMHVPFTHKSIPLKDWLASSGKDINEINYLNSVNYTDAQIKKFFDNLNKRNLLESTVIFIVSDHSQTLGVNKKRIDDIKEDTLDLLPMVFIAVNTGLTQEVDAPVGQVNVFPTILHVLNKGTGGYRGLDRSLLDPELTSSVSASGKERGTAPASEIARQKRAWEVSDSLQRSNFFGRGLIRMDIIR